MQSPTITCQLLSIVIASAAAFSSGLLDSANTLYTTGKLAESIVLYKKAMLKDDNPVLCNFNCANAYFQLDSLPQSVVYYRLCIADAPDFFKAHLNLAVTYYSLDDLGACIAAARRGLALDAANPKLNLLLAVACRRAGATAEAVTRFEKIIADNPAAEEPYIALGEMYRELADPDEALRWLSLCPPAGRHADYIAMLMADIYESTADYSHAIYCLQQAFASDKKNKWALYRIASLQEKQGNDLVALETARDGMDMFPDFPEIALAAGNIAFRYKRYADAEYCYNKAYALGSAEAIVGLQNIRIIHMNNVDQNNGNLIK